MEEPVAQQHFFMTYALSLGEKARLTAPPNPWVGSIVVKNGTIVGEGWTSSYGGAHAEVVALEKAGGAAKGATVYATLEPCSHTGRTPPCVDALIKAKVARVILPFEDPDPLVSGQGIAALQRAGIEVKVGVAKEEAERSLRPYLFHRKYRRPYTILKLASSLDGRTAAFDATSKWITGEEARRDVHRLRAASCAIAVGANTARIDHPALTVRGIDEPFAPPKRILFDRSLEVSSEGYDSVFTTKPSDQKNLFVVDEEAYFEQALEILGAQNIIQLLVEGGAKIHSGLFPFAQQLTFYLGNCLLGPKGLPSFSHLPSPSIKEVQRLQLEGVYRFENDIRLDYTGLG
ncbi:MAG: Riboflavin biosynthesis protein RibD [Chlamydiales bacterium]|nr:Riboflavin biosynthesis protein RibD [Chlamydiales bacterium]MCH9619413.1 Riboflavin biosynthesis protein RibD [Chlamydiales bacterium]MCH9622217.1 Riboflavin biosynthesis protein RibD [Chlamydiales bacterium]